MPKKKPKTDREVVDNCNELARMFYMNNGYQVPKGYRFDRARHPQEMAMFRQAELAYEFIEGTDVDDALASLDEGE